MTYEAVESALATQIRATSGFDDDQVSIGDFRILGYGHPQVAILTYSAFRASREEGSYDQDTLFVWTVRVYLYARYNDDDTAHNLLRDRRDEIIMRVLQQPTLGAVAFDSFPVRGSVTEELIEIGSISFLREYIDIDIEERVAV
jgi:hypothetical protein